MSKLYTRPLYLARWMDRFKCPLPLKLNTYSGCSYQCSYCFASNMRMNSAKANQHDHSNVIPADIEKIRECLENKDNPRKYSALYKCLRLGLPLQIGPLSDPFQPTESEYKITKQVIELLGEYDYPFQILTKGGKLLSKYSKYLEGLKCVVHVSLSTMNQEALNLFEPGAPTPDERLKSIKECSDNGVVVQHRLWPILPLYDSYSELDELIGLTSRAGCRDVIADYLRVFNYKSFNRRLGKEYLSRLKSSTINYVKNRDYYHLSPTDTEDKYYSLKSICDSYGVGFYNPTILHFNDGKCCCGTDDYLNVNAPWALQLGHHKITKDTTFDEYIQGTGCPYPVRFERFWNNGKLSKAFFDVEFNKENKTYSKNMQTELV